MDGPWIMVGGGRFPPERERMITMAYPCPENRMGTSKEKGTTFDDLLSSNILRIFDAHTHARAWIQHDFLLHPVASRVDFSFSLSLSLFFIRAFPPRQLHPSLARFSNAWHKHRTHARAALLAATPRYKEATLRRAATVSRSSPRRAQKRDPRYPGSRHRYNNKGDCLLIDRRDIVLRISKSIHSYCIPGSLAVSESCHYRYLSK